MLKRFLLAFVFLLLVIGGLAAVKGFQIRDLIASGKTFAPPPIVVSAAEVASADWETRLSAIGTLESA